MKKLPIFFAAVIFAASLSAFTAKRTGTAFYRDPVSGLMAEKDESGRCDPHPSYACEYTPKDIPVDNDPTNPANYDPVPTTLELVWIDL